MSKSSRKTAKVVKLLFESYFNNWNSDKNASGARESCIHGSDMIKSDEIEPGRSDQRFCYRECILKHYYEPNEGGQINPSFLNKIFLNGWVLHEKWQELFEKYSNVISIEETVWDEEHCIAFTPDARLMLLGKDTLVEIKGYKSKDVEEMDEDGEPPKSAYKQVMLYCRLLGIKDAIILVENKDSQSFKVWHVVYDESKIPDLIERLDNLKKYLSNWKVDHTALPKKICESKGCDRAKSCTMSKACFASDKKRETMIKEKYRNEE